MLETQSSCLYEVFHMVGLGSIFIRLFLCFHVIDQLKIIWCCLWVDCQRLCSFSLGYYFFEQGQWFILYLFICMDDHTSQYSYVLWKKQNSLPASEMWKWILLLHLCLHLLFKSCVVACCHWETLPHVNTDKLKEVGSGHICHSGSRASHSQGWWPGFCRGAAHLPACAA